jgi:hypothetical protein
MSDFADIARQAQEALEQFQKTLVSLNSVDHSKASQGVGEGGHTAPARGNMMAAAHLDHLGRVHHVAARGGRVAALADSL